MEVKRGRGRPRKEKKKRGRPRLVGKYDTKKYIKLTCKACDRKMTVTTTKPELYTEEVKKNWTCPFCKRRKGYEVSS